MAGRRGDCAGHVLQGLALRLLHEPPHEQQRQQREGRVEAVGEAQGEVLETGEGHRDHPVRHPLPRSGETERGRALVADAIQWTSKVPSGYYASSALAALRERQYEEALSFALRIDAPDWPLGHIIVAAAGALGGRADLAKRARERLIELEPGIATKLPDVLRRWRVEPVLAGELERGFAAAQQP